MYEINTRYAYVLRSIGRGKASGEIFSAVMNLLPPNTKFERYNTKLLAAVTEVCEVSIRQAAKEFVLENEGRSDVAAAFDGHTSMNGVVTLTSFDTGEDECLSKFCTGCVHKINVRNPEKTEEHKIVCAANYEGSSGGMEVAGAPALCARSKHKLGLRYVQYLGDGDSKGFAAVIQNEPMTIMLTLPSLNGLDMCKNVLAPDLDDTNAEIDLLQRYYSQSTRKNVTNVEDMRKAIRASYFHISTDANPQHFLCPSCVNSCCKLNQAKAKNQENVYTHQNSLPETVMAAIKPVFNYLSKIDLLKRCLRGKTQHPKESFNGKDFQNSLQWAPDPETWYY
ncbi:hypothetical protein PR048_000528 [Dryococelus australis]|uniref:Mutator-like transposase domain-containing protein n=1 Tax=Dryococelus australis TaxID=614101 RepID=A0ABQ9IEX0_9NEOP|nr:hypothetical protein PR048_000528 [Dryococelus australis]